MEEIYKLPIPLRIYQELIRKRRSPYYDIVMYILREMDNRYKSEGREFIYVPNIQDIEKRIQSEKLTKTSIIRSILAWVKTAGLNDDEFYITKTAGGGRRYHIRVNERTLSSLRWLQKIHVNPF